MLIKEIILENFMSYQYVRIPLKSGLNIICGPNGSGKSSILLAISIAMGQAYTERSRKLSDLIRWGQDAARVSLIFDNEFRGSTRPLPEYDSDRFRLSRYLNKDGSYWFEVNSQVVNKIEVTKLLSKFGLNPDNMLIIMHQHMMVDFCETTPLKKLLMVEEAVGLSSYRTHVLEAKEKLSQVLSEEESVSSLFTNAEQTLDYWKSRYEKYRQKKQLLSDKTTLESELIWAQHREKEMMLEDLKNKIEQNQEELVDKEDSIEKNKLRIRELGEALQALHADRNRLYDSFVVLEKEKMVVDETISRLNNTISEIRCQETDFSEDLKLNLGEDALQSAFNEEDAISVELIEQYSKQTKSIDEKLDSFQTQVKLCKQEAEGLDKEKKLLQQLMRDRELKEESLKKAEQQSIDLLSILEAVSPSLISLDKRQEQVLLWKTKQTGLENELNNLVKMLPVKIDVETSSNPLEFVTNLITMIEAQREIRKNVKKQISNLESAIRSLTHEKQETHVATQVCKKEFDQLTQRENEIRIFLKENEKISLRCDKCGSTLTPTQLRKYLEEVEEGVKTNEFKLVSLNKKLLSIEKKLSTSNKQLESLLQEEHTQDIVESMYDRVYHMKEDISNSMAEYQKAIAEQDEVLKNIAEIFEIDPSHVNVVSLVTEKTAAIRSEIRVLKIEIPKLEKDLLNFEDLYLKTQQCRVDEAQRASENYRALLLQVLQELKVGLSVTESQLNKINQKKLKLNQESSTLKRELDTFKEKITTITDSLNQANNRDFLLNFQREELTQQLNNLTNQFEKLNDEMVDLHPVPENQRSQFEPMRSPSEISAEIRIIDVKLSYLTDVSEDIESMYESYLKVFNELKEKLDIVSQNRNAVIAELEERKKIWRSLIQSLINEINPVFQAFLEKIDAIGSVKLVESPDFELSGLNLTVGFKGAEPQVLDSRTHSGGERSSATMAFLLALQHQIKSPFRAVDEFDVHMDPQNRETTSKILLTEMGKETTSQYITITPGQIITVEENTHVITVQRTNGLPEIKIKNEKYDVKRPEEKEILQTMSIDDNKSNPLYSNS